MPDSIKQVLHSIASQCYVSGGPSVFLARSMYFTLINDVDWQFNDACLLSTGFFKREIPSKELENSTEVNESWIRLYPNSIEREGRLKIDASQNGTAIFYNSIGEVIDQISFSAGIIEYQVSRLQTGIVMCITQLENGYLVKTKILVK